MTWQLPTSPGANSTIAGGLIRSYGLAFGSIVMATEARLLLDPVLKPRDQVEGSGMGLAIVLRNIESSGGKLDLESSEGNGSTFRFTLPRQQIDGEAL
jgi:light-regulated signal transduction histidine kinase (bacteriophytochrome)